MSTIIRLRSLFSSNKKTVRQQHHTGDFIDNRMGVAILLLFFLFLKIEMAVAVPACPEGVKVAQPDGTEITIYLRGDEYSHWNENENGYLITKSEISGEWVYMVEEAGTTVAGKYAVGKADPKAIGALKPDKEKLSAIAERSRAVKSMLLEQPAFAPHTGTMYNLVILVNFSDLTVAYSQPAYDDLFNQIGYTTDGAVGSVKDYYHQISYNALTVQSTVVEAVTLDNGYAYYGANDSHGDDIRPREMVQEALAKLEARGFDFKTVDDDNDGWIDGLTIIHAGGGEEYSGNNSNYIWSHQWQLSSPVTYDGVSMLMYHTEPARRGWDGYPSTQGITRIGVICHENGHFLGLPDLYDYGYDSYGAGDFCLMAGGSWNGDYGTSPAHMSAWCKCYLGWVSPTLISSNGVYSLGQVETNSQIFKLQGGFPSDEYFMVENRQGSGFDSGLPGSLRGILIWHVDESQVNNDDQTHYKVDLEEASGTQHLALYENAGDDADYFRAGNATMFTDSTVPNNLSYSGQMLNINITNVGTTGVSIPVTFGAIPSISSITPNTGASGTTVNITNLAGTMFQEGAGVKLMQTGQPDIVATNVIVVSDSKITCTFSLAGVATGAWNVRMTNPDGQWAELTNGFNVTSQGTTIFLTEGFESAFVSGAPPGWTKSYKTAAVDWTRNIGDNRSTDTAHGGTYNAMLYYSSGGNHETYLVSPVINFGTGTTDANLEFWHKQVRWPPDQDTLKVYYKTSAGGSWTLLASYTANVTDWIKRTISLPNLCSTYYIGFLGNAKYGYGVCIDDVKVTGIISSLQRTLSISSTAGGHTEPNEGDHQYNDGTVVDVNAIPNPNCHFVNWTGTAVTAGKVADPNSPNITVLMDANYTVQANFAADIRTLTVSSSAGGTVTQPGIGIFDYNHASIVDLNAASDIGYHFVNWLGDTNTIADANAAATTITMDANYAIQANFAAIQFTINASADGNGTVEPQLAVVNYGGSQDFNAVANTGYEINEWFLDGNSIQTDGTTYTLSNITANHNIYVTFKKLVFVISGYVFEQDGNTPVGDVLIQADNNDINTVSDANGYYELWVNYGWSGIITPQREGYVFEPNRYIYTAVTQDYNDVIYTATLNTFVISGYVFEPNAAPLSDVNISAENGGGPWTSRYGGSTCLTDMNGYYQVQVDYNWSGNVVPMKYAYAFEPNSRYYQDVKEDWTMYQDFNGILLTFKISGYVKNACSVPIAGVLVDADAAGGESITDVNGFYEVWVDYNWSGTVIPGKAHYMFAPADINYIDVLSNQTNQNYQAANIYDLDCDGSIGFGDIGVLGDNWLVTGENIPGDIYKDENNIVNFLDLSMFAEVWLEN